ncbi:MAG: M23 family metallopeptidase [Spirochaetia bacterium]|nr:M23 family metallopeptidase [Spirochaetia bacterium]
MASSLFVALLGTAAQIAAKEEPVTPKFQWPLVKGEYPDLKGITSTFAESRGDHFHSGLDVASAGDPIKASANGTVVYTRDSSDQPYLPVFGPGNVAVIDHGAGWWSGYYHLSAITKRSGTLEVGDVVGKAGNSGHSGGSHLHFFIAKDDLRTYVNPLSVLPAPTDKNAPVIGQLLIVTPKGRTLISHSRLERVRLTKRYPVQVIIFDQGMETHTRRGIYKLKWKLNDSPEQEEVFETLRYSDTEWKLGGLIPFDGVFQNDSYNLGELPFLDGKNTLNVTAEDKAGNATTETFEVNVSRSE